MKQSGTKDNGGPTVIGEPDAIGFLVAQKRLEARLNATPEEVAMWVLLEQLPFFGWEPVAKSDTLELRQQSWTALTTEDPNVNLPALFSGMKFSRAQVESFDPSYNSPPENPGGRFLTYQQTVERLAKPIGDTDARALIEEWVNQDELLPCHYVVGVVSKQILRDRILTLEQALFMESQIQQLEEEELPSRGDIVAAPQAHGERGGKRPKYNAALQDCINRVGMELRLEGGKVTLGNVRDWFKTNGAVSGPPGTLKTFSFEPPIPNCDELYIDGKKLVWKDRDGREQDIPLRSLEPYFKRASQVEMGDLGSDLLQSDL